MRYADIVLPLAQPPLPPSRWRRMPVLTEGRSGGGAFRQGQDIHGNRLAHPRSPARGPHGETVAGSLYGAPLVDAHRRALWEMDRRLLYVHPGRGDAHGAAPAAQAERPLGGGVRARGLPAAHRVLRGACTRASRRFASARTLRAARTPCARSSMRRCSRSPMRPAIRSAARCRRGCSKRRVRCCGASNRKGVSCLRSGRGRPDVRTMRASCCRALAAPAAGPGVDACAVRRGLRHGAPARESPVRARPKSTSTT